MTKQKRNILFIGLFFLFALVLVYSNHFDNSFHFDDAHSIVNNVYIRDLNNISLFFKDAATISSLPANQSYRPLIPFSYAIDYWIADGLNPFYFHLSSFIFFIIQCILIYFVILRLLEKQNAFSFNPWIALFFSALYAFHTANAETINYISARSDSISTFWLILSLWIYIYFPKLRWYGFGFFLIPIVIGILVKPAVLVFPGIIFFYHLFFETEFTSKKIFSGENIKSVFWSFSLSAVSLIVCIALYLFQAKMTPDTFIPGSTSRFDYLITQPYVSLHYFKNFFIPNDLSADTDWTTLNTILDKRFFIGTVFIFCMLLFAWVASRKKHLQGISFGIIWFFIALLPSSSIIPFAEVMNDHRTFFPYIGLIFASATLIQFFLKKKEKSITTARSIRVGLIFIFLTVICIHSFGTYKRNIIWDNDESLWHDVTVKSPNNARGWMNYGLSLMAKAQYADAEKCFNKTLSIWPYYSYCHVNMGILKSAIGNPDVAEQFFRQGISYGNMNPEAYYYYAEFLNRNKRSDEAIALLKKGLEISPAHSYTRTLLMSIYADKYQWKELRQLAEETLKILPGDAGAQYYLELGINGKTKLKQALELAEKNPSPENYLSLSLEYYNEFEYDNCILAAEQSLKLKPGYADAYNNIGSAYNQMGKFEEAEKALNKALQINPGYQLAKNNIALSQKRKKIISDFKKNISVQPSEQEYLKLSLFYYYEGMFFQCIEAAEEVLKFNPNSADAYNTICSAYNNLRKWDDAIKACEQAIRIKPDFELAKNNLNWAKGKK